MKSGIRRKVVKRSVSDEMKITEVNIYIFCTLIYIRYQQATEPNVLKISFYFTYDTRNIKKNKKKI